MVSKNDEAQKCANTLGLLSNKSGKGNIDMNIVAKSDLNFQGKAIVPVSGLTGIWLTSTELADALQYKSAKSVTNLFNQNADEFTSGMTQVIESVTSGNYRKKVRVFSLRGAHLIAMFARTPVAKEFRRWVLDILDKEVEKKPEATPFYRYKAKLVLLDDETGEKFEILGQAKDLRTVAYGLASDLGYRPNAFTHIPVNAKKLRKIH